MAGSELLRLCRHAGFGVRLLDALPLAGANAGAPCLSHPRPLVHLPADRRHLHALLPGLAARAARLDPLLRRVVAGRLRGRLQEFCR